MNTAIHTNDPPAWKVFEYIFTTYSTVIDSLYKESDTLIEQWDKELLELAQDPTHSNWHEFGPLRLQREEDWSDTG